LPEPLSEIVQVAIRSL